MEGKVKEKLAVKCVVVGNFTVGKTTLISTYAASLQQLPQRYDGDPLTLQTKIGDKTIHITLCDTAGEDPVYDRLRPLVYPEVDVFLICFSVTSPASYENVRAKWCPELNHLCPNVPRLLVGTKIDLRSTDHNDHDGEAAHIRPERGEQLAAEIGAVKYLECSATTQEGLEHVVHEAIRVALEERASKTGKCSLC